MTTPTETGRVISAPPRKHECHPGWTARAATDGKGRVFDPPSATDYPKGTVWECSCVRTWVSRGRTGTWANIPSWRRESRLARWRRTRKAAAR